MSDPLRLNVLKSYRAGDTREITERELRRLRVSDAYDSYSKTYRLDGLVWRVISHVSRADGETIVTLQAAKE